MPLGTSLLLPSQRRREALQQDLSKQAHIGWHSVDKMDSEPRVSPRNWLPELGSNQRPTD